MRKRTLKIEHYTPFQELELVPIEEEMTELSKLRFVIGGCIAIFLILTFLYKSFLLIIIGGLIALALWLNAKSIFLMRIVFTPTKVFVEYDSWFSNQAYKLSRLSNGLYWFADFNKNPALIKIGLNGKVIVEFNLNTLAELPEITEKVAEIAQLDMVETNTLKTGELIRFKKRGRRIDKRVFKYIIINRRGSKVNVLIEEEEKFSLNLSKNTMVVRSYEGAKTIDLTLVKQVYYWIEINEKSSRMDFRLLYLMKGQTQLNNFFELNNYEAITEFSEIRFREEANYLIDLFRNDPALQHIEVDELRV